MQELGVLQGCMVNCMLVHTNQELISAANQLYNTHKPLHKECKISVSIKYKIHSITHMQHTWQCDTVLLGRLHVTLYFTPELSSELYQWRLEAKW